MQLSKSSKKSSKTAKKPSAATPQTDVPAETGRAKHRVARSSESKVVMRPAEAPVLDPVGIMTSPAETQQVTREHIAQLAYSYWIARDYAHGFSDEDWHRAERELNQKR